ncbi:TPA: hypothetical protein ENG04_00545 [Candidatus Poribacteria bacterium]|nr:hypothetical protein [Candidatus Poribacteria bacterium]HEX28553.1 hypothetical protein [Candidatus Poribacteria bacterium]
MRRDLAPILSCLVILVMSSAAFDGFAEEYRIKAGDTLSIFVLGHEGYNLTIPVRADGKISYFYGDLQAAGLTVEELSERIRERLRFFKNPEVLISVQPVGNEIFVFGAVRVPNRYILRSERISALKAIAMAGGYDEEKAELESALIIRSNGDIERIDLKRMLAGKGMMAYLSPGDSLYVPEMEQVKVSGYVIQPGSYRVKGPIPLASALAMAGGPIQGEANLRKVIIFKPDGSEEEVRITDEFWSSSSPKLHPGETLYVPSAYRYDEVNILGYVRNPGSYRVKREITLFEALALAGGALDKADLGGARIIHPDGRITEVNIKKLYENPDTSIKLYPGDTLYIPRGFEINWAMILTLLSVISTTITLLKR